MMSYLLSETVASSTVTEVTLDVAVKPDGSGRLTGDGIDCPSECSASIPKGEQVSLTAKAEAGFKFLGWKGGASGTDKPVTIKMNKAKKVTATFGQSRLTLTVKKTGTGGGDVTANKGTLTWTGDTGTGTYSRDASVTLTGKAASGSGFTSWAGCDDADGNKCTVAMTKGKTVTATFDLRPPTVASLSPTSGPVCTQVTITGTDFGASQGSSVVKFKGVPVSEYLSWSNTRIKCKAPDGAATGAVKVTTPGGTSNGVAFTVLTAPTITSLSPTSGGMGTVVTLTGTGFGASRGSSVVSFKGAPAVSYTSWSEKKIKCGVPDGAATGAVKVTTGGGTSNGVKFTVTGAAAISSAGPDQKTAGSARVKLSGANSVEAAGGAAVAYKWTQIDGPSVRLSHPQSVETAFMTPEVGAGGESLAFELTITAGDGSQSKGDCLVNATDVNQPPAAHAGTSREVSGSEVVTLDDSRSEDPDGEAVGYAWKQIRGSLVALSDSTSPRPTFVAPDAGPGGKALVFELTVTDPGGLRSRDRCVVNVTWENAPPRAAAGPSRKVKPGAKVRLDGFNSFDNDDGIASHLWTQTAGVPVKLSDPTAIRPTFAAPETGAEAEVLVFELTVTDRGGLRQTDKVTSIVKGSAKGKDVMHGAQADTERSLPGEVE